MKANNSPRPFTGEDSRYISGVILSIIGGDGGA